MSTPFAPHYCVAGALLRKSQGVGGGNTTFSLLRLSIQAQSAIYPAIAGYAWYMG